MHAVFLLVRLFVLFIDHDEAELVERKEQSRARADDDARFRRWHTAHRCAARFRGRSECHSAGRQAETLREAVEKLAGKRDLGQQDQGLAPAPHALGDSFEINLGLARPGDAVEERNRVILVGDGAPQGVGGLLLRARQVRSAVVRVGRCGDGLGRKHDRLQRALVDEPVDHPQADAGLACRLALGQRQPFGQEF